MTEKKISSYHGRTVAAAWRNLLAFFLPILILTIAYAIQRVFPFGDRHILTVDLYHQYAPFLGELRSKILSGQSLFFSWSAGLGFNFYPLFAYYLASPLNVLLLLFPPAFLSEAVLCLTLVKVGLAGFFFHLFLKHGYLREGAVDLGFSLAYALSSYVLAYSWNIMWLDSVYLLPLAALGLVRLVRGGSVGLYSFALFLIISSNYYSGFFACIALFLYFIILLERFHKGRKLTEQILSVIRFAFASLMAAGMAMLTLLPTLYALQRTSAAGDQFPVKIEFFDFFIDFLSRLLPFSSPSIRSGMPNIYCGTFVLPLLFVYLNSKKIPASRKAVHMSVLFFVLLSFNNNFLNFIWHGFHYPNQLPFRYSFVFVFLLLAMLYDALPALIEIEAQRFMTLAVFLSLLIMLLGKMDPARYPLNMSAAAVALIFTYAFIFALTRPRRPRPRRRHNRELALLLFFLILTEITLNTAVTIDRIAREEYFGLRDGYRSGSAAAEIMETVTELKANASNGLCRMEILPDRSVNDAMLYQSNGMTIFSSTFAKAPIHSFANFGYPNNGINSFQYCGSTIVMDTLLGIDYLLLREGSSLEDRTRKLIKKGESGLEVWQNEDALPIAYVAQASLLGEAGGGVGAAFTTPPNNPFQVQDSFAHNLCGSEKLFESLDFTMGTFQGGSASERRLGDYDWQYTVDRDGSDVASLNLSATVPEAGSCYLSWQMSDVKPERISVIGKEGQQIRLGSKSRSLAELGWREAGEKIELRLDFRSEDKDMKGGMFKISAVRLLDAAYQDMLARFDGGRVEFLKMGSRDFSLRTDAPPSSCLFISSSWDPGWKCRINGVETEIVVVDDCFMAVVLPEGKSVVEMSFTPQGFYEAIFISGGSVVLFLFFLLLDRRQPAKKAGRRKRLDAAGTKSKKQIKLGAVPLESSARTTQPEEAGKKLETELETELETATEAGDKEETESPQP